VAASRAARFPPHERPDEPPQRDHARNHSPAQQARLSIGRAQRERDYQLDGYRYLNCGTPHDLTLDHVVRSPLEVKRNYRDDELATRCRRCNSQRGALWKPLTSHSPRPLTLHGEATTTRHARRQRSSSGGGERRAAAPRHVLSSALAGIREAMEGSILALLERHGFACLRIDRSAPRGVPDRVRNALADLGDREQIVALSVGGAGNRVATYWRLTDAGRTALAELRGA